MKQNDLTYSQELIEKIGGAGNIKSVFNCSTRLRFELKDDNLPITAEIESMEGVIGVVKCGGQYQVIVGAVAPMLCKSIQAVLENGDGMDELDEEIKERKTERNKNPLINAFSILASVFTPIFPAIIAAGMIQIVLTLLTAFNIVQADSETYQIFSVIGSSAFYFLPVLLANSAALRFKCNPYVAMTMAFIYVNPSLTALLLEAAAAGTKIHFFGIPVIQGNYPYSVIPIILSVWLMAHVEKFVDKLFPKMIRFMTTPLLTLLIVAPISLIVLGPAGSVVGGVVADGVAALDHIAPWIGPAVVGAFTPLLVMCGMHYALSPLAFQNVSMIGADSLVYPGFTVSNIAQGGSTLAVALKTKIVSVKQLATSSGVSAVLGITEPALYGVGMKYKTPLAASMIGGGVGGLYCGIMGVKAYTLGYASILGIPQFIGGSGSVGMTILHACMGCLIAFGVAFAVSFVAYKDPVQK